MRTGRSSGSRVRPGNPGLYGNITWGGTVQGTGGSSSTTSSWERYRRAGAVARALLVQAAATAWAAPQDEITVERGIVGHASGQSATWPTGRLR